MTSDFGTFMTDWFDLRIPVATPVPDALWEVLREGLPQNLHDLVPLVRRDLEGTESAAINADTKLLLLIMVALQQRVWKQGEESKHLLEAFLAVRGAQLDALERASTSIAGQIPLLDEAVRIALDAEKRAIADRQALEETIRIERKAWQEENAAERKAAEERNQAQLVAWKEEMELERKTTATATNRLTQTMQHVIIQAANKVDAADRNRGEWQRSAVNMRRVAWTAFVMLVVVILGTFGMMVWASQNLVLRP